VRDCQRANELIGRWAGGEPIDAELRGHAATCPDCAAALTHIQHVEPKLQSAAQELVTDAVPVATLQAARFGAPVGRPRSPRFVVSGMAAVALSLFAVVGVSAAGVAVLDAMRRPTLPIIEAQAAQALVSGCFVEEVTVPGDARNGEPLTVTVEQCLADRADEIGIDGGEVAATLNRMASSTTECLRTRGWDVTPVLEPGGRFLIPPASPPPGADEKRYVADVRGCAQP
jgi:hypothetical protein